jgi:hypothetical protein
MKAKRKNEAKRQHKQRKKVLNSIKKSASQRVLIEFEILFNKIFDMIANFFNVIKNNNKKND